MNAKSSIKKSLQPSICLTRKASVLFLSLWFVLGALPSFGAEMMIVTKADNGKEIKVASGGTLRVELPQAGSAGYAWEIQDLDTEHFEVLEAGTVDRPAPQDIVGAPVTMRWVLLTKKAGSTHLRLLYYRPWEGKASTLETFMMKVEIY